MTFQIALEPNYSAFCAVCEQFSVPSSFDPGGVFRELEKFVFSSEGAFFFAWFSAGGGLQMRRKTKLHFFTFLGKGWSTFLLGPQRSQKGPEKNNKRTKVRRPKMRPTNAGLTYPYKIPLLHVLVGIGAHSRGSK